MAIEQFSVLQKEFVGGFFRDSAEDWSAACFQDLALGFGAYRSCQGLKAGLKVRQSLHAGLSTL